MAEARALLRRFSDEIRAHIRYEEEQLLPIFRRAGRISGGAPELFINEHRKIEKALTRLLRSRRRDRVAIIEEEFRLKELLRHHDLREKNILYPVLDRVATPQERAILKDAR